MKKRVLGAYCALLLAFGLLFARIAALGAGAPLAQAADIQSTRTITVSTQRAIIYDRNLEPLVGRESFWRAAVFPSMVNIAALKAAVGQNEELAAGLGSGRPFVLSDVPETLTAEGVTVFELARRYTDSQIAPHLVGYLGEGGSTGVYGAERAFDDFLKEHAETTTITYYTDGGGFVYLDTEPVINAPESGSKAGVVLTIDSKIQERTERALKNHLEKGAAVVMEVETGEIIAAASVPDFSPLRPAASLEDSGLPFINRAFSEFAVGSTFKLVVAAAALEAGYSTDRTYECKGSIDVAGQKFACHWAPGHGKTDMVSAIQFSCNTYFIDLALELGPERIREMAANLGFGARDIFAESWETANGNLPVLGELSSPAATANFGFGQGGLMATPVQIAKMVAAIANGGFAVTPVLVVGTLDEHGEMAGSEPYARNRVIDEDVAAMLRAMMVNVVEEGSGTAAKPVAAAGGAGGKTASAQTGVFEGGREKVEAWFAGFFPALSPKYAIVIFAEGMESGGDYAAPVFREIANGIYADSLWRGGI